MSDEKKPGRVVVDLTAYDTGKPHWLHPLERYKHIIEAVRAKHLARRKAEREAAKAAGVPDTPRWMPEEQAIIALMERSWSRKLTEWEIALCLEQARAVGEL